MTDVLKTRKDQDTDTHRRDHVKTQGEDSHLQVKEGALRRNQPCQHLDLGLSASRSVRRGISVFEPPRLRHFVMAVLANKRGNAHRASSET